MQRYVGIGLITALGLARAWGALPAATTWELRTLGNASNGGCFVAGASGTDFSQQNAAQYTFTDLVLVTSTTATSAGHSFIASDVGNCIHITAGVGFTQGFYQIVSVAAGTATLDSSAGTGGSTGGTYAVGGAVTSPVTVLANVTAQNQVWMKADGTYTTTATAVVASVNSAQTNAVNALTISGYTTTRGDNGRAAWTTATNSNLLIQLQNNGVVFQNLTLSNTAGVRADAVQWGNNANDYLYMFSNCSFDGFNIAINVNGVGNVGVHAFWLLNSEIKNSVSHGMTLASANQTDQFFIYGSYIHANGGSGVSIPNTPTSGTFSFYNSIIASNTTSGILISQANDGNNANYMNITSCDIVNNTSDGITVSATGTQPLQLVNNIIRGNGGFGVNVATRAGVFNITLANAYGNNTSGARQNYPVGATDVTLTADPFTNAAGGNYALNSTAGGGAAAKAAGWPGVLAAGGTGFADIGALQSAAGGGGSTQVAFPIVQ